MSEEGKFSETQEDVFAIKLILLWGGFKKTTDEKEGWATYRELFQG